jgi:hypothetical protein
MMIPTDEERAAYEAAFALQTPAPTLPTLDTRVAAVEAAVAAIAAADPKLSAALAQAGVIYGDV